MRPGVDIAAALACALEETIESMAFAEVCGGEKGSRVPPAEEGDREVSLRVSGPVRGWLLLVVAGRLAEDLAENIYGLERGEITPEMRNDAMAEVLNTVAGRFMDRITCPEDQFEVGLPAHARDTEAGNSGMALTCAFSVNGLKVALSFAGGPDQAKGGFDNE